jgi:hypothetical protein
MPPAESSVPSMSKRTSRRRVTAPRREGAEGRRARSATGAMAGLVARNERHRIVAGEVVLRISIGPAPPYRAPPAGREIQDGRGRRDRGRDRRARAVPSPTARKNPSGAPSWVPEKVPPPVRPVSTRRQAAAAPSRSRHHDQDLSRLHGLGGLAHPLAEQRRVPVDHASEAARLRGRDVPEALGVRIAVEGVTDHVQAVEIRGEEGGVVGRAKDEPGPPVGEVGGEGSIHELAAPRGVRGVGGGRVHELREQRRVHLAGPHRAGPRERQQVRRVERSLGASRIVHEEVKVVREGEALALLGRIGAPEPNHPGRNAERRERVPEARQPRCGCSGSSRRRVRSAAPERPLGSGQVRVEPTSR